VVVQTNAANRNPRYPNTIAVTVSTTGRDVPSHVRLEPTDTNGLSAPSFVKCEQLLTIGKERLREQVGRLGARDLKRVAAALRVVLAL
jgi:mRNA-degrading endonuclease toxin of MazEF toxin-antitoxin module